MTPLQRAKEKLNEIIEESGEGEDGDRLKPWYLEELFLEEIEAEQRRRRFR